MDKTPGNTTETNVRATAYSKFMSENMQSLISNNYEQILSNVKWGINGLLLTPKHWKQETTLIHSIPNIYEMSSNIEKQLIILLWKISGYKDFSVRTDSQTSLDAVVTYSSNVLISLCNYIYNSFLKLGVNNDNINILNEKLAEIVDALGSASKEISKKYFYNESVGSVERPRVFIYYEKSVLQSFSIPPDPEAIEMQVKLDNIFFKKCAPALFTIQSYLELFMEISSKTNNDELSVNNKVIYSDLIAAYKTLEKISTLMFEFPTIVMLDKHSRLDYSGDYSVLIIPDLQYSEVLFKKFVQSIKGNVPSGYSDKSGVDSENDINDAQKPIELIQKIFKKVDGISSIEKFDPSISTDINDIFAELEKKNQLRDLTYLSDEIKLLAKWLAFIKCKDNSSSEKTGN